MLQCKTYNVHVLSKYRLESSKGCQADVQRVGAPQPEWSIL